MCFGTARVFSLFLFGYKPFKLYSRWNRKSLGTKRCLILDTRRQWSILYPSIDLVLCVFSICVCNESGFAWLFCSLRPLDVEFMKALHEKVNIVPVLAKADTLTPSEIKKKKIKVSSHTQTGSFQSCDVLVEIILQESIY